MDTSYIISKMNEYMFRLNQQMGGWLEKKLPKITDDWWQDLVFNNLSPLQRETVLRNDIHEIKGLDLAALLRVLDRNWFVITSTFFINNKERGNIRTMQEIRNTWAHITPNDISKARVIDDVNVIIALMQAFDASMKDTRDMENFIFDVEEDKDIHAVPAKEPVKEAAPAAESPASAGSAGISGSFSGREKTSSCERTTPSSASADPVESSESSRTALPERICLFSWEAEEAAEDPAEDLFAGAAFFATGRSGEPVRLIRMPASCHI